MSREFSCKYIIKNKEYCEYGIYDYGDGESTHSLLEANRYNSYKEAKESLKCFDEPEKFDIIRISIEVEELEIM